MPTARSIALLLALRTAAASPVPAAIGPTPSPHPVVMTRPPASAATSQVLPTRQLVVPLDHRPIDGPRRWTTRQQEADDVDTEDLLRLITPHVDDWPEGDGPDALLDALCSVVEGCEAPEEQDQEALWAEVRAVAEAQHLLDHPPGTVGDPWDRYLTLWLSYVEQEGFFVEDETRAELLDGLAAARDVTWDGPLAAPLLLAQLVLEDDEARSIPLAHELTRVANVEMARLGLLALDGHEEELDAVVLDPDSELALLRDRLALEAAVQHRNPGDIAVRAGRLARHPLATDLDRMDLADLAAERHGTASTPWERALAEEARDCAEVTADEVAELVVVDDQWSVHGADTVSACLFGWSWPDRVPDQRIVLRLVR